MSKRIDRVISIFREHNGIMRTQEAIDAGIYSSTLSLLCTKGILEKISRGLYRLIEESLPENPDFVSVSRKVPGGVICLISALSFYELTLQIPHEVYIALHRGARKPKLDYPPVRVFTFIGDAFSEGVETKYIDRIPVKIYCIEKTIADSFKFRNKIGLDTATEALRAYIERKDKDLDKLMYYADICRVSRVIRPYIEALI